MKTPPVCGIGFGQKGYWGNRHFSSVELGKAAYDKYCAEIEKTYSTPCLPHQWTGKFEVESIPATIYMIEGKRFIPLKKNGQRGARVHTVHFYRINEDMAKKFLEDLFYSVEA